MATLINGNTWTDNASLAHFTSWAKAISDFMGGTAGWVQSNDPGQVVWLASVTSCTAVAMSGSNATYTYTLTSGPALRVGMTITITGMTNAGNNVTGVITALGSGTFTIVNASGVAESGSTGTGTVTAKTAAITTANNSLPSDARNANFRGVWNSSTAYAIGDSVVLNGQTWLAQSANTNITPAQGTTWHLCDYEIWKSTDSLSSSSPIYVKFWYLGSSTVPALGVQFGVATDGNSNITTNASTTQIVIGVGDTTSAYESDFAGGPGWFSFLLFRTKGANNGLFYLGVDRSYDALGNTTSNYFQYLFAGGGSCYMQLIPFPSYGSAFPQESSNWPSYMTKQNSGAVGSNVFFCPVFPFYGKMDNPLLVAATCKANDITEAATYQINMYGTLHTYIATKNPNSVLNNVATTSVYGAALLMRWE